MYIENMSGKGDQVALNGRFLEPSARALLADRDVFAIADRQFRFDYGEGDAWLGGGVSHSAGDGPPTREALCARMAVAAYSDPHTFPNACFPPRADPSYVAPAVRSANPPHLPPLPPPIARVHPPNASPRP